MNRFAAVAVVLLVVCMHAAAPALAQAPMGQEKTAQEKKRMLQSRLDAERRTAIARTQHRLSETAPPQSVAQDRVVNDPALRRHVRGANSLVHP